MEITRTKQADGWVELNVTGRLDSDWADHFTAALDELIREGTHKIRLNLAGVSYLSSAGIGALIRCHKLLESIRGKLIVVNPSEPVKEVLQVARLSLLLTTESAPPRRGEPMTVAAGQRIHHHGISFEVFNQPPSPGLTCRLIGDSAKLPESRFGPEDCRRMQFPVTALGVGLGALGQSFADCRERFGEFLAAAGTAAYLPTGGANRPDYLVAAGDSVPELQVCYGLICEGDLGRFARFEVDPDRGRATLSSLARGCLDLASTDRIGFVFLGETAGLIGAALRRAPVLGAGSPFTFPQVRDWLSFSSERAFTHAMTLVVGVVVRGNSGPLETLVRPLGTQSDLQGHCHAAAFSYRPLPRGELDLRSSVTQLFEQQALLGIMHLLADHRETVGLGESEFIRGACWFGPIDTVENYG